jgi:hypothetical protein
MKPARARALSRLPATTSARTRAACRRRKTPSATSVYVRRFTSVRLAVVWCRTIRQARSVAEPE